MTPVTLYTICAPLPPAPPPRGGYIHRVGRLRHYAPPPFSAPPPTPSHPRPPPLHFTLREEQVVLPDLVPMKRCDSPPYSPGRRPSKHPGVIFAET